MLRTFEAVIDENGNVQLLEAVRLDHSVRALVTILDPGNVRSEGDPPNTAALSEVALAADWERPEEDAAWVHLQPGR